MSENFGQIPDKVRYNNELTFFARLIYSDILSLAKKENFCFATNQYFAGLYNVSQKTVSISIKELEKEFCISVELTKDSKGTYRKITPLHYAGITKTSNGVEENVKPRITKTSNGHNKNVIPVLQKCKAGMEENVIPKEYITNNIESNIENNIVNVDFEKSTTHTPEKKSKVEKVLYTIPHDFSTELKETFEAFMLYKKQRKESYKSEHSINLLIKKIQANRVHFSDTLIIEVINMTMENNWAGIFFDKIESIKNKKKIPEKTNIDWDHFGGKIKIIGE